MLFVCSAELVISVAMAAYFRAGKNSSLFLSLAATILCSNVSKSASKSARDQRFEVAVADTRDIRRIDKQCKAQQTNNND